MSSFLMVSPINIGLNVLYKQDKLPNRLDRKIANLIKLRTVGHWGTGESKKRIDEGEFSSDRYLSESIE